MNDDFPRGFWKSEVGGLVALHGGVLLGSAVVDALRGENFHRDIDVGFRDPMGLRDFLRALHTLGVPPCRERRTHWSAAHAGEKYDFALTGDWIRPFAQVYLVAIGPEGPRLNLPRMAAGYGVHGLAPVLADVAAAHCRLLPGASPAVYLKKLPLYVRRGWSFADVPAPWDWWIERERARWRRNQRTIGRPDGPVSSSPGPESGSGRCRR